MAPTCVLAAGDHVLMRSLKRVVDPDCEVVAMVDNTVSLMDSIQALEPNLVVIDIDLLGSEPARILEVLRGRSDCPPLIGLSSDEEQSVASSRLGLDAVVARPLAGGELPSVAREVLSRAEFGSKGNR
jgi:DNA-binding response OmpR family regulator